MKNTTKAIFLSLNNLILSIPDNELGKLLQSFSLDKTVLNTRECCD